ncbi:MAG: GTP cyclohydrolase I FolE [Ignisphaera sp.]|nr:GTP cyclohydrolase I FolE [Ignisphaera sp.]
MSKKLPGMEDYLYNALAVEAEVLPTDDYVPSQVEAEHAIETLIRYIGADMKDPNCIDTPRRVIKAWSTTWGSGYTADLASLVTTFPNDEGYDEMIIVKNIPIYSTCSHHLAPFHGFAHIAYIPNKELIGLSKFVRIADVFARRLQLQERLTDQIANAFEELLAPFGVAVYVECEHMCMSSRGVKVQDSTTVTTALRGAFKTNPETRAEFLTSCKG